jgi:hypothetical protein
VPAGIEAEAVPAQIARITAQAGKEGAKAMASKNLGAVIQRAISDGAFRRQLQSDPAAALRGFNLSPDEVAAIRSGDSGKLMSLGIDQRMSKAFAFSGTGLGGSAVRSSVADLNAGSTSNALTTDNAASRDGIIGDPGQASREAISTGTTSGVRAINDNPPFEGNVNAVNDPTVAGTRTVNDVAPFGTTGSSAIEDPNSPEFRNAAATGDLNGVRAINDVAPFGTTGSSAIEDPNSPEFAAAQGTGDLSVRAVNDVAPFGTTGTSAIEDPTSTEFAAAQGTGSGSAASAALNDPYSGQYQGVSPDFQARMGQLAADDTTVSSRMADAGDASSIRSINDVEPFEGNVNAAAASGSEIIPTDELRSMEHTTGGDALNDHGNALGNTGDTGDEHSWG